jgi:hypothetical protein
MRQQWNKLIQYGLGLATIFVLMLGAIGLYLAVGLAVVITKVLEYIK